MCAQHDITQDKSITCRLLTGGTEDVPLEKLSFRISVYALIFKDEHVLLVPQWDGYDFLERVWRPHSGLKFSEFRLRHGKKYFKISDILQYFLPCLARNQNNFSSKAGLQTRSNGGIDLGESIEDALTRELFEETGLTATIGESVFVANDFFKHPNTGAYHHSILLYYLATNPQGTITTDHFDEFEKQYAQAAQWVPLSRVDGLVFYNPIDSPRLIEEVGK